MPLSLGSFEVQYGSNSSDYWSVSLNPRPGRISVYLEGSDYIEIQYMDPLYKVQNGKVWSIPSIVSGGGGADRYSVSPSMYTIICDASTDILGDTLNFLYTPVTDVNQLFSLDNRHVFIGFAQGGATLVLDALNQSGKMETITFQGLRISGEKDQLQGFLDLYGTRRGETIDSMVSKGEINLESMGLYGGSEEINCIADSLAISQIHNFYTIFGDRRPNTLTGSMANEFFRGMGGADYIVGAAGDDFIFGDADADVLDGSEGVDTIDGGYGNDYIVGGVGVDADYLFGGDGDDTVGGGGGPDHIYGQAGNDEIRGGHGKDLISGGSGADILYGGGGANTFLSEYDGAIDNLFILSDFRGHAFDWGRNHGGINADLITELDSNDRITILGTRDSALTFRAVVAGTYNQNQAGIGIFDGDSLEALYLGSNLNAAQLDAITTGDPTRFF